MSNKTLKSRLVKSLTDLLEPLCDSINVIDNNALEREPYEKTVNEWHNKDVRSFMEYNLINPIQKSYKDRKGVEGCTLDRAEAWMKKAEADACATVGAYQNPGDNDARPTRAQVERDVARAEKARAKYDALLLWATVLQEVYFNINGFFYDEVAEDKKDAALSDEIINRYGTKG